MKAKKFLIAVFALCSIGSLSACADNGDIVLHDLNSEGTETVETQISEDRNTNTQGGQDPRAAHDGGSISAAGSVFDEVLGTSGELESTENVFGDDNYFSDDQGSFLDDVLAQLFGGEYGAHDEAVGENPDEYDRDAMFPHWSDLDGDGCNTREEVLARDLEQVVLSDDGCFVESGVYHDPFSGRVITLERGSGVDQYVHGVDIDHIVPLHFAFQNADTDSWGEEKRERFANDPGNLVAMDVAVNRDQKRDHGPAGWLPSDDVLACQYGEQFSAVADKYNITLPAEDVSAINAVCQ